MNHAAALLPLLLASVAALPAAQEAVIPADRLAHTLVLRQVYLNGQGPLKMMVDTGAASSIIRPEVAARIGIQPRYAVEQVTVAGSVRTPVVRAGVTAGTITDVDVELLVSEVALRGVDGILGQSWLARHTYLLDFQKSRLVLDAAAPENGLAVGLRSHEGRPGIAALVDGVEQELVIDSGASSLILFRRPGAGSRSRLLTNQGSVEAATGMAVVRIGDHYKRIMAMAELDRPFTAGLLPAVAFRSVYVAPQSGVVVLVPR